MSDIIHFLPGENATLVAVNSLDEPPLADPVVVDTARELGLSIASRHPHGVRELGLRTIASTVLEVRPPLDSDPEALRAMARALVTAITRGGHKDAVAVDYLDGQDPAASSPEDFEARTVVACIRAFDTADRVA
ncbi:hypothetical protein KDA14_00285 [Candidatus Saccharibacteria bacterium]|nr:hypothetical protein [Candidatus Saccharibacteria bacterium]